MSGWIKLHRKILDWERYNDHNTSRLFIYILLNANHTDKKRQGIDIKKGTFITSFQSLARGTGLSIMQVRTGIKNLERSKNVTRKVTSKYQAISVCGWEIYQNDDENVTRNLTGKQQANNKQITTTKNDKEGQEGKEELYTGSISSFVEKRNNAKYNDTKMLPQCRKITEDMKDAWRVLTKTLSFDEIVEATKNYIYEITQRDKTTSYAQHRFTLGEFIQQKNGARKFYNLSPRSQGSTTK